MHITLTGGGTAGHVTPNLALIEELKSAYPDLEVSYIGSKKGLEKDLVQAEKIDFYSVSTGKLRRYFSLQNLLDFLKVPVGITQSFFILHKLKPNVLFSKGGYVALPVVIGAWLNRIPVIIHESDSILGLATKITAKFAKEKWSTFQIKGFEQVALPIRKFLYKGDASKYKHDSKPSLLVMGGSQGANAINKFVADNLENLSKDYQILHVTGKGKALDSVENINYQGFEYVGQELADLYAASDYILCRAGASTLAELKALNKKVILIPLPSTQSRGDQIINAEIFVKENPAVVLAEENLNLDNLSSKLTELEFINETKTVKTKPLIERFKVYF